MDFSKIGINVDKVMKGKSLVRNFVMNYSEIEAKVIDATNNEAWGASGTVSQALSVPSFSFHWSIFVDALHCNLSSS